MKQSWLPVVSMAAREDMCVCQWVLQRGVCGGVCVCISGFYGWESVKVCVSVDVIDGCVWRCVCVCLCVIDGRVRSMCVCQCAIIDGYVCMYQCVLHMGVCASVLSIAGFLRYWSHSIAQFA